VQDGRLHVHPDIRVAETLPGEVYVSPALYERVRERVFVRSWQLVGDAEALAAPGHARPFRLLPGCLDEPLVLCRGGDDRTRCFSNVCTHRGNLVVQAEGAVQSLRCGYHGRRFGLDGRLVSMPEFADARNFPRAADDLAKVALERWQRFLFASLAPSYPLADLVAPMTARIAPEQLGALRCDPEGARSYEIAANWALYCDNYLEGFHIPYVHAALAQAVELATYRTELFPWGSLQVALAKRDEDAFTGDERVAAYYFWLFPNTMFNFYPWGLSINIVEPLGPERTRIVYQTYVSDPDRLGRGAGGALDRVEREDDAIVEAVQQGMHARLYRRGRYSPTRELGVHHFHRLLAQALAA
jgi:choline monooxygenase